MIPRPNATITAVVTLAFLVGGWAHLTGAVQRHARLSAIRAQADDLRAPLGEQPDDHTTLLARAQDARARLSPTDDPSDLLQTLLADLADLGVTERSWTVAPTRPLGLVQSVGIDLSMSCGFEALCRLLARLDTYPRLTRVEQVIVKRDDDRPGLTRTTVRLATFSAREGASP